MRLLLLEKHGLSLHNPRSCACQCLQAGLAEQAHLIFQLEVSTVCSILFSYSSATYLLSAFMISKCLPCNYLKATSRL